MLKTWKNFSWSDARLARDTFTKATMSSITSIYSRGSRRDTVRTVIPIAMARSTSGYQFYTFASRLETRIHFVHLRRFIGLQCMHIERMFIKSRNSQYNWVGKLWRAKIATLSKLTWLVISRRFGSTTGFQLCSSKCLDYIIINYSFATLLVWCNFVLFKTRSKIWF